MTRAEMVQELRSLVDDMAQPYRHTETSLLLRLTEGEDLFCFKTGFFLDNTNYTITTTAGTKTYALPSRFLRIYEVWGVDARLTQFKQGDRPFAVGLSTENTTPQHYQLDQASGYLTFYEPPTAGLVYTLRGHRKSRSPLNRTTSTVTLGGTLHTGDVVAVTINGTTLSYTTLVTDLSLSAVATALAAVIDATDAFTASASGQVVSIASSDLAVSTTTTVAISGAGATTTATATDVYTAEPEIPDEFRYAPVMWAAHKIMSVRDLEEGDKADAARHLAEFEDYCRRGGIAFRDLIGKDPRLEPNPLYSFV